VQGTGGALVFANNAAILTDAFPPTERGRAIGINQVAATAGSVLGLVAGGVLTAYLGWRSIFWINLPVGVFATTWAYLRLKELGVRAEGEGLDPLGNGLFAVGLSVFLVALTFGALAGWSFVFVAAVAIGLLFLVGFGVVEFRVRYPMMDLSLFRIKVFTAGIFSNLLAAIARGAVSLVLVFYFQGALGLDALYAGLQLIPFALAFVSIGPLSGYLSDKYGSRGFATAGLLVLSAALFWFAVFPFGAPYTLLVLPMILTGIGAGLFAAPNIAAIMNSVPVARRGVASGITSTLFNTGVLLSLGIAFAIMAISVPLSTLQNIFAGLPVAPGQLTLGPFIDSMRKIFLLMGSFSLIAAITSSLRGSARSHAPAHESVD
jgi:MFS family permease